uniref:G-protein coupled receptors family 1 profile domain-containing protein n=1 Tax=Branchiostoma floridae TaxID=7739 RepID=C3YC07_BRAFL|eukprot:XP_002606172.1 hypothetical protein BRAFLDRAFT_60377 [Branchiostoma floridae]
MTVVVNLPPPPSLTWAILTGTSLSIVTLTSILGNALVLVTLTVERHLRTPANSLIGSLAVADLLVSLLVMPISASYELTQTWRLGRAMCDIWIILDVTCCTASIMSLCIIALDRYWAITDAVKYVHKRTPKRMMVMIGVVWLLSLCISIPPVFGWRKPEDTADPNNCLISQDHAYTIFSTFGAFYIPLIIVLAVYYKIFRAAQARIRKRINSRAKMGLSQALQSRIVTQKKILFSKERKAAQTLGVITGVFVFCWLPFFLVALIGPFCSHCHISDVIKSVVLWLGYVNSMVNPFLYAFLNKDFQKSFKKILFGRR